LALRKVCVRSALACLKVYHPREGFVKQNKWIFAKKIVTLWHQSAQRIIAPRFFFRQVFTTGKN